VGGKNDGRVMKEKNSKERDQSTGKGDKGFDDLTAVRVSGCRRARREKGLLELADKRFLNEKGPSIVRFTTAMLTRLPESEVGLGR